MLRIIIVLFGLLLTSNAKAQEEATVFDSIQYHKRGAVVMEGDTLFYLYDKINGISARERAVLVNQRLQNIVASPAFSTDSMQVEDLLDNSRIIYRHELLVNITINDAKWYGAPPSKTAADYHQLLIAKCDEVNTKRSLKDLLIQIGLSLLVLVIAIIVIKYVNRLFRWLAAKLYDQKGKQVKGLKIKNYEILDEQRSVSILLIVLRVVRILLLLIILYFTLPTILKIFPWTEGLADKLFGFVLDPVRAILQAFIHYVPNLFTILVIVIIMYYITKGVRYLAHEIQHEKLKISGFYPDWGVPTARLINFILYVFMLVLVWPYLPGSDSAIFQGVSVFLGLLISMGSTSAISNIVSGLVITYMRPFKIGDRVRIGEVSGDIIEKTLLVTRIRTIKNEIITVPNSNILTGSSINYSMSSTESAGLIIHTGVTIGYDVPWRKVHEMLMEAAAKTPRIEKTPAPFVLQTSLDDFYVAYQINAYTNDPSAQALIYSDLHALIQDVFAKNGVEIMSPHYRAMREGPDTTPPVNGSIKTEAVKQHEKAAKTVQKIQEEEEQKEGAKPKAEKKEEDPTAEKPDGDVKEQGKAGE